MPIETADDLAVFFNPEEFGKAAVYTSPGGVATAVVAIRDESTIDLDTPAGPVPVEALLFDLRADVVTPERGGRLQITGGLAYLIAGRPRLDVLHGVWSCEVQEA